MKDDCVTLGERCGASLPVILTWAVVGRQVAAVAGRVGEVGDHHADAGRGAQAPSPRRLAALRAQRRAGTSVRRLPQLPSQEEGPHLASPGLAPLVVLVVLLPASVARQPLPHPVQRPVTARQDGQRRVVLAGPQLPLDALFELAEGGGALVLHDQVVHAGRQVVAGELDRDLNVSSLLLLLARLGVELVPPATETGSLMRLTGNAFSS